VSVTRVVLLDAGRSDAVGELLAARASAWAHASFEGAEVVGAGAGEGLTDALRRADSEARDRPLVVISPVLPVWPGELALATRSDLEDGCALAVGPIFDGGFYLVALAAPIPGLAELPEDELSGRHGMNVLIELATRDGLEVGLLRTQRGLRHETDVRAMLADPLTDEELRRLLR
jgi:glycosyltransferase A (GT-A) superfamily protein (DUF2064 family)